ncbi:MAG: L-xylulokinase [Arenicella sp.]
MRLGVDELFTMLPPLHSSTQQVATVSAEAAAATGLAAGTRLFMGGPDVSLGPAGIGDLSNAILICVFGSWSVSVLNVSDTTGSPLVINHPLQGHFLSGLGDDNAGIALDKIIDLWFAELVSECELSGSNLHQTLEKIVSSTDRNSLLFIPHVFGSMLKPVALSGLLGLRAQTERKDIFKAICEGILLGYFPNISLLPLFEGVSKVWLIGAGAKGDLIGQMMADIFGRQVLLPEDTEITARGAAVCAMLGSQDGGLLSEIPAPRVRKRFTPDTSMAEYYSNKAALISKILLQGDPLLDAAAQL